MLKSAKKFDGELFLGHLQQHEHLRQDQVNRAMTVSMQSGTSVERVVVELGLLEEATVYAELAAFLGLRFMTLKQIDKGLVETIDLDLDFLKRVMAAPVNWGEADIQIAVTTPDPQDLLDTIAYRLETNVTAVIATPTTIKAVLEADVSDQDQDETASSSDVERLKSLANDGPTIKLVNDLIGAAVEAGASDIHIEAQEQATRVRFRVDGRLQTDRMIPASERQSVVSRLKIMTNLNISEKRRPQDGRTEVVVRGRKVDIRLSTLPTQFGESIVLRLLDRSKNLLSWNALGFAPQRVAQIRKILTQPNGIFLVAGPVGSGKTTTLYTALSELNSDDKKIVTVEDPIEYSLEGIAQVQVDEAIDLTFGNALRAITRQDLNVLMIGEIRDEESAAMAVRAALLGRLVISTIHTNDSLSSINRLLDLEVPPYLLADTLRGVLSQRLVRRLCKVCQGEGCNTCGNFGTKGRVVVSECLEVSQPIAAAIAEGQDIDAMRLAAVQNGFSMLADEAEQLVGNGVVSKVEALSVVGGG